MRAALDLLSMVAIVAGAFFFLAGTVGLLRFPDSLTRRALRQERLKLPVAYSTVAQIGYLFLMFPLAFDDGGTGIERGGALAGGMLQAIGNLTQLLAKIQPAIKATTYAGDRTADSAAFVDAVARKNVELTMDNIRKNSTVIAELEKAGTVKIAGAFYDLKPGAVEFLV